MSSSTKLPSDIRVRTIQFFNGSSLGETNLFEEDVTVRKRMRVDSDLTVSGKIPYVDDQTGWGLPSWTFSGQNYSKSSDSLIAKLTVIQNTYATKAYVDTLTFGTEFPGLTWYNTSTYPRYDTPSSTYSNPVTTLAANSSFIIREKDGINMELRFQKGSVGVGKVLGCLDADGLVGWVDASSGSSTITNSIESQLGPSNTYSFRVIDTGTTGTGSTRGWYFYPNILNNSYNASLLANDFTLLAGIHASSPATNLRTFIGTNSYGGEGISFSSSYATIVGGVTIPVYGQTVVHGPVPNQKITLKSDATQIETATNQLPIVVIPHVAMNTTSTPKVWRKPFVVQTTTPEPDLFPTFMTFKTNSTDSSNNRGVAINPSTSATNWNPVTKNGDITVLSGNFINFVANSNNVLTSWTETDYQFVVAPISAYHDGIRIRPTLSTEETQSPKPQTSGYTRISSGSQNNYWECNRNGLFHVMYDGAIYNYGNVYIINKTGPILNQTDSTTVSSSFNVGTISSQVQSLFKGDVFMSLGDIYLHPKNNTIQQGYYLTSADTTGKCQWSPLPTSFQTISATNLNATNLSSTNFNLSSNAVVNQVLTCTNASTGKGEWKPLDQVTLPTNVYFSTINAGESIIEKIYTSFLHMPTGASSNKILKCVDLTGLSTWGTIENSMLPSELQNNSLSTNIVVSGHVATNSLEVYNIVKTEILTDPIFNMVNDIEVDNFSYGTSLGEINSSITHFNIETLYFIWMTNPVTCGTITVPTNYSSKLQFQCPLHIVNQWAFKDDNDNFFKNKLRVNYRVEQIDIFIVDITNPASPFLVIMDSLYNSSIGNSDDFGLFYFDFERDRDGPNTDEVTMRTYFTINNASYQFTPVKRNYQAVYKIDIKYYWSYYYYDYDGSIGNNDRIELRNYWGNNASANQFPHFLKVVLNQTFDTTFYIESKYQNQSFIPNTHSASYFHKGWSHSGYVEQTNFNWSSYNTRSGCFGYQVGDKTGSWSYSKLRTNIFQTNSLYIGAGGIVSLGLTNSRGYSGRKGIGTEKSQFAITAAEIESTESITTNHWFNWWWTGSKIRTYVDTSWMLDQSPNVSDYRIKKNFRLIPDVLPSLCATTVWSFDVDYDDIYKVTNKVGVIAHELAENCPFAPNLVDGKKDAVDSQGKILPQRLEYQELTILLLKAVQELKEENDRLKIQIEELFKLVHSQTPP